MFRMSIHNTLTMLALLAAPLLAKADDQALHQWVDSLYEEADICYGERSDYRGALALLDQIIPVCEQPGFTDDDLATCTNLAALTYVRLGDFEHAIAYAERTLALDRRSAGPEQISASLNSIAGIYLAAERPEQGEEYIREAIEIERKLSRPDALSIRLGMASEILVKMQRGEDALPLALEAVELEKPLGDPNRLGIRLSQLAGVYYVLKDDAHAEPLLQESLANLRQAGNLNSQAIVLNQLGAIAVAAGQSQKAARYYAESASISQQTGNLMVEAKARQQVAESLRDIDPKEALAQLTRYVELSQQLYSEQAAQSLSDFNARYATAQKEHEIALLKEQMAVRHLWIFALVVMLVAAMLFIVFMVLRYRFKQLRTKHDHFVVQAIIKPEDLANVVPDITFTPRELEVINYCAEGLLAKEIAERMHIAERTVTTHKNNIFKKIGVQNTMEMVMYARKTNLLKEKTETE